MFVVVPKTSADRHAENETKIDSKCFSHADMHSMSYIHTNQDYTLSLIFQVAHHHACVRILCQGAVCMNMLCLLMHTGSPHN